jgi:hypothetical protein
MMMAGGRLRLLRRPAPAALMSMLQQSLELALACFYYE